MTETKKSRPSQRDALRKLLKSSKPFTMDELEAEVSQITGGSVRRSSLYVAISNLRTQEGLNIESTRAEGVTTYKLTRMRS